MERRSLLRAAFLCTFSCLWAHAQQANAIYLTDYNPNNGTNTPCTGPGHVLRFLTMYGWDTGPTAPGLTFDLPTGVSLDANGRLYIADRENRRIVRMDDVFGANWLPFSGTGANALSNPGARTDCTSSTDGVYETALDSAGRIYIVATNPAQVVRINDMTGAGWTALTSLPGDTLYPSLSIALDAQNRIYLLDNQVNRILRVNDIQGSGLVTFGSYGNGAGQFHEPSNVVLDSQGRIYISDEDNHRIIRINDLTGAGWTVYGAYGSLAGQLSHPHGMAFDSLGRLYIEDTNNQRVVRIDSMDGSGWVAFGNHELLERGMITAASKGVRVAGTGPDIPYISIVPRLAVGGSSNTTIVAMNAGASALSADFSLLQTMDDGGCAAVGSPLTNCSGPMSALLDGQSTAPATRLLSPMGMARLEAVGSGHQANGYARIKASSELNTFAIYRSLDPSGLIHSEATVGTPLRADHFTIYLDNTNNAQSGYTIVNAAVEGVQPPQGPGVPGGWITFTVTLRDKTGAVLDTRRLPIPPGAQLSELASQRFPGEVAAGFEGSLEFSSGIAFERASVIAWRSENPAGDVFTTLPVFFHIEDPSREPAAHPYIKPVLTTTAYYPHTVDGASFRTAFLLVNTTDTATTATLDFYSDSGAPQAVAIGGTQRTTYPVQLPARSVTHVLTDGLRSDLAAGWARLTAPIGGIGGAAIIQSTAGPNIVSEAGLPASAGAARLVTHIDALGGAASGVAICNPGNSAATVNWTLRDASGRAQASGVRSIPALGRTTLLFAGLLGTGVEGTLEILPGTGAVSAAALRFDNPGFTAFAATPVILLP